MISVFVIRLDPRSETALKTLLHIPGASFDLPLWNFNDGIKFYRSHSTRRTSVWGLAARTSDKLLRV